MKSLVLAEKPSVGRDIARVLHCTKKLSGALEGDQYVVTWALGHLVTLADPEEYDKKYQKWDLETLPMIPAEHKLVIIPESRGQYQNVKAQLQRKDVSDVIIATDAGREGELVARWILEKSGCKKKLRRLWISSVTDKAIKEGFAKLKNGAEYDDLYRAAAARAEADWLVGMNGTRALTCKFNAQLSCGRVQTPTLRIIQKREEEIKGFVPKEYYGVSLEAGGIRFSWKNLKTNSGRTFDKELAEGILAKLKGGALDIITVTKKKKAVNPPGLYDLTTLQREASQKYGYSPKETLNIMQSLYEFHKVLTYPRTDSRYLTKDVVPTIKERLKACAVGPYKTLAGPLVNKPVAANKSFVDDTKVSDHHAIIPTEQFVQLLKMTNEEKRIYDMVVRRFLAVLSPACEYEEAVIEGRSGGELFTAKGRIMLSPGWKAVYTEGFVEDEEEEETEDFAEKKDQKLPEVKNGQRFKITGATLKTGKTNPPKRFTEATLLAAMENPVKYMESEDKQAAKTLGETGGLGTVATRADIIEKLFSSFMMEKKGSEIHLTSKAKQLLTLVPEDLRKPELTASWEMKLSAISKGKLPQERFLSEIKGYTKQIVEEIRKSTGTYKHENMTNKPCPVCGKKLLLVKGKKSEMLVCQDRECGYRETISRTTNARCPNCHKKMEMITKGSDQIFVCACGFKESLSAFQKRREKEGAGVNKNDVANYMRQQKKEDAPINNAFAEALKGIKL